MYVTHMELLARIIRPDGIIEGKVVMHGLDGEHIQIHCELPPEVFAHKARVNSALAREALRQLRRMPEFRRQTPISVSRFGMPTAPRHRVINLMNKGKPIAGCQVD